MMRYSGGRVFLPAPHLSAQGVEPQGLTDARRMLDHRDTSPSEHSLTHSLQPRMTSPMPQSSQPEELNKFTNVACF